MFSILLVVLLGSSIAFAQWNTYPSYPDYAGIMNKFQASYPQICRVEEFGSSVLNRKLLAVKISDNVAVDEAEPAVLYLSTIHGDEVAGYPTMLHLIDYLLSNYGTLPQITALVDNIEIWILPLANPDGTYKAGDSTVAGAVRGNANNIDLNRNFPQIIGSTPPPTQKETDAIIAFCEAHTFIMSIDFHAGAEQITFPWGFTNALPADYQWFSDMQNYWQKVMGWPDPIDPFYKTPQRFDYALFNQQCRAISAEITVIKMLPSAGFPILWEKLVTPMLFFIEQALYGIRGTVKDSLTGKPLNAKVFIENHDKDSSWIFSHLQYGDYYRPIASGIYSIIFSAPGYYPQKIEGVYVTDNQATVLDVKLIKETSGIIVNKKNRIPEISVTTGKGYLTITFANKINHHAHISLFNMSGALIRNIDEPAGNNNRTITWNGLDNKGNAVPNGSYVARIALDNHPIHKKAVFFR
jgi:hypothetical protein